MHIIAIIALLLQTIHSCMIHFVHFFDLVILNQNVVICHNCPVKLQTSLWWHAGLFNHLVRPFRTINYKLAFRSGTIQSSSPHPKFFLFQWSVSLRCYDAKEKICCYTYMHGNFRSLALYDRLKFWSSQRANHALFERKPQHEQNSWKTTVHSILVKATVTCWSFRNLLWVLITISK